MALALEFAKVYIQDKLHEKKMTHLHVRRQGQSLIIYSHEWDGIANRALLTRFPGNEFSLCISDPRGKWQLIQVIGELPDMLEMLIDDLAFALARWPDERRHTSVK
ncbi:hypothetical protein ACF3MZ_28340 [Paenibacillaceae bacterium WGS1546]|uniref:hypothetical protein n=1 Tax=Cohnella sp. WGS1546 TaxID=3366810 RepID=UPI00372CF0B7